MLARDSLTPEVLERLYLDEGLSLRQVAERLGPPATKRIVQRALQRYEIPLRPPHPPASKQGLMSRELLERLYVDEGRNLEEIAVIVGVSVSTVKSRMKRLEIPRRKGAWRGVGDRPPMTKALLHRLRVVQLQPLGEIAEALGYSEIQVRSALRRHGLEERGRSPKLVGRLGRGELWWLYHHEALTVAEIGRRLRTKAETVSARMTELDVPLRSPGRSSRLPRPVGTSPPDMDLLERVLADADRRPRRQPRSQLIEVATPEELRRLHHERGMGITAIGSRFGCSPRTVRDRLNAVGIEVRHRRGRRGAGAVTADRLERLTRLCGRGEVMDALDRQDIAIRADGEALDPPVDLTARLLRDLYEGLELSVPDIGLLTARSPGAVSRALRHHGIDVRRHLPQPRLSQRPPVQIDREKLVALAADGGDAAAIASALRFRTPTTVRIAAQVLEVPLPGELGPPPVPAEVVAQVRQTQVSAEHAAAVLEPQHLGVGAARGLPAWPWPPSPSLLRYLYHSLGIGLVECADRLRCDVDDLKAVFRVSGIDTRRLDEPERSRRWRLDPEELHDLYAEQGLTVEQIAEDIGVSRALIYRTLHRHHLPVVPTSGRGDRPRVRYDELLADTRVRHALASAGVAAAGVDPPIRPVPLPTALLAALVEGFGLSTFDVELLTGRLARSVREDCKNAGIQPVGSSTRRRRPIDK